MSDEPKDIDSELTRLFDEQAADRMREQEMEKECEQFFSDLLSAARTSMFALPDEFTVHDGKEETDIDFTALKSLAFQPRPKSARATAIIDSFYMLIMARGSTVYGGRNCDPAIETRDAAVGGILASDEFGQEEKDRMITLTNTFLEDLVDPIVLPTAINPDLSPAVQTDIGRKMLEAVEAEDRVTEHNYTIRKSVKEGIRTHLDSFAGEHDDKDNLVASIYLSGAMLLIEQNAMRFNETPDEMLDRVLQSDRLDELAERMGMSLNQVKELVLSTNMLLRESGYIIE